MTNSPNSGQEPEPTERRWRRRLLRATIILGGVTFATGVAGAWWAWIFVQEKLAPLVETSLSKTLNRPVQLGAVEQVTLSGLRFGASALPPTPIDRDRVNVDAVEVGFNLLEFLLTRRLGLNVTLIRPNLFVDQTPDGRWISAQVTTEDGGGSIKTELDTIRVQDGTIALSPSPKVSAQANEPDAAATPLVLTVRGLSGSATLQDQNQYITFEAQGLPTHGGNFKLRGETRRGPDRTNLTVQARDILASDVSALLPLPLSLKAGRVGGNLAIGFQPDTPISIDGTAGFRDTTAEIANVPNRFSRANGRLRFQGQQIALEEVRGFYGQIPAEAGGSLDTQKGYNLTARVRSVTVGDLLKTFDLKTPIALAGALSADLRVTGAIDQPLITGTARNTRTVRADRIDFDRVLARFNLTPRALTFDQLEATPSAGGAVSGSGRLQFGELGGLAFTVRARDVGGDAIARRYGATNPNFTVGRVNATAQVVGPVSEFQTRVQWQAPQATYPAQGEILVANSAIQFRNTQLQVAGGTVQARGEVVNGRWQAFVEASQIALSRFSANVPGQLSGEFNLVGTLANLSANGIRADGQVRVVDLAGGTLRGKAQVIDGRWQAAVQTSQVALNRFSSDLRGLFSSDLQLSGTLANLSPDAVRAAGQVRFSEGLALLDRPLTASIRWLGDRLQIQQATAPGFSANGVVLARLTGTPAVTGIDLNVLLQNYDLAAIPVTLPNAAQVSGQADFNGRVQGTLTAPRVAGQLQLENLVVNNLAFDPVMAGKVQYIGGQGTNLDLSGQQHGLLALTERDRIAVRLDNRYRPTSFLIRQGDAIAQGNTQGDILTANVQNFPLEALNLTPAANLGIGAVGGLLTADASVNLVTLAAQGTVAIDQPRLGYINAARDLNRPFDRFTAQFRYANGEAVLNNGELRLDDSRYLLAGSFLAGADPQFRGKVTADQGRLEDLLAVVQYFDLQDLARGIGAPTYDRAADLNLVPVGLPNATLLNQLRRFSEIAALQDQQREQARTNPLPSLSELKGAFSGDLSFAGSGRSGITADFSFQGQDWQWGKYGVQQVTLAQGRFENGVVTVLPLRLDGLSYFQRNGQPQPIEGSFLSFSGQVGGQTQSGQLQARRIPVGLLRGLTRVPIALEGELNATATLSGSATNPQANGELNVTNATLNNAAVQQATSFFSYSNARLNFTGRVVVSDPQPLTLSGSIPYRFPFMTVFPDSDALSLDINVRDEGIALLNLFQNQVTWVNGQGEVKLQVRGTVLEPLAIGTVQLANATLLAQALPEPLTNVSSSILFNRTQIGVENFQGQFDQGQVSAQGVLPTFTPTDVLRDPVTSQPVSPLSVNLNGLALNFKGLYNGGVDGRIVVTGAAIAPLIGGNIVLSDGRVSLPDTSAAVATTPVATNSASDEENSFFRPPEFKNLLITLGDRLLITREPILNFVANGDLLLNGTLAALEPSGTIRLRSGQVNLVTTQFNLDRGYEQTAVFRPNQGLDPFLNVQLIASVSEVTRTSIQTTSPYSASEIAVPAAEYGSLQTIRIRAKVYGAASQIFQNLELTSSPSRSQNEIIALIGGGVFDTLQRGDATLAIANIAGSALLANVQNFIGNTLGLSEFRLFPTNITDSRGTANFGLAAELGVDITRNLSVSVLQILTSQEPTQFGLRYRFNDQLLLRSSTNLSGETRAVLEFEQRF
jgi:translocation and assembly module TamB